MAAGHEKLAKGWSMNPAQLVSAWVTSVLQGEPDTQLARVIKDLHAATHGRHMTHTSAPLRKWVAERTDEIDETEVSDEEIVNDDIGGHALAVIDPEVYAWIDRLVARSDVLEGAEAAGLAGVVQALTDRGLPVEVARRPDTPDGRSPPPLIHFGHTWRTARRPDPRDRQSLEAQP